MTLPRLPPLDKPLPTLMTAEEIKANVDSLRYIAESFRRKGQSPLENCYNYILDMGENDIPI